MAEVLMVGSMALDTVETPWGKVEAALGGAATYASCAASFFTGVRVVAVVGEDFPEEHLAWLRSRGIDTAGIQIAAGKTFHWSGYYDTDLNVAHTRRTDLNVFASFNPTLPPAYRQTPYVFLANIDPQLQLNVLEQVDAPRWTAMDTMNFWIERQPDEVWKVIERVHLVLLNEAEARQLCQTPHLIRAGKEILAHGPQAVIVKKGEHGAVLFTAQSYFSLPAYPLEEVVDPTGAGDSFAGGLMGYLACVEDVSEARLRAAMVWGSVIASFNVEDFSLNRQRHLTRPDLLARYQAFEDLTRFEKASWPTASASPAGND